MNRLLFLFITFLLPVHMFSQMNGALNEWVEKGNAALRTEQYQEACRYYELAQKECQEKGMNDKLYGNILDSLAVCCSKLRLYSQAVDYEEKALEIYKETLSENHSDYVNALGCLSVFHYYLGDNAKAVEYGLKTMELRKTILGEKHPDYARSLNNVARYYSALGDNEKAVEYGTMAIQTLEENHPIYTLSLSNLASYYAKLGNYSKAVDYEVRAMEIRKTTNHPSYSTSLNKLTAYYSALGDYSKAAEYGEKAIIAFGEDHPNYVTCLNNQAFYYSKLGDFYKAVEYETKVLEIYRVTLGEKHADYAEALDKIVSYYSALGDYSKTVEYGNKVLKIRKSVVGEFHSDFAKSLNNLSLSYSAFGFYEKALVYGIKAMEIYKNTKGEVNPNYAATLTNIARYYSQLGDYIKALEFGTKAVEIYKATCGEKHPEYAKSLNNLSLFYSNIGDYGKGVEYATKAVEIIKTALGENHRYYAMALNSLALCYSKVGHYNKAVEFGVKSLEIYKNLYGEHHRDYATSLNNIALYYSRHGDYAKAMEYGSQAMEIRKSLLGIRHPSYATSLGNMANYYYALGNYPKAVEYEGEALEIRKNNLGKLHPYYAMSLGNLARYYSALGDYKKANNFLQQYLSIHQSNTLSQFSSLSSGQRAKLWAKLSYQFTDYYPYVTFISQSEKAEDLYDKSALFAKGLLLTTETEMNKLILESGDEEALEMFEELRILRMQLQKLYDKSFSERHINVDSLEIAASRLENELVLRSKAFGDYTRKLRTSWKDVQAALGKDEIAIEFLSFDVLGSDSTMVAALTLRKGDKAPKFIPLFEQGQMEALDDSPALKRNLRDREKFKRTQHFIRPEVTNLVWKPLQEELQGIHHIYFSPAGILHSIGVEYLPGMEEYDMRRLSSTREIIDIKENRDIISDNTMATLYGGIDYEASVIDDKLRLNKDEVSTDSISRSIFMSIQRAFVDSLGLRNGELDYLPGTLIEVKNIKSSLEKKHREVSMFTGENATETSVKALSAHTSGILHIATHGIYYTEKEKKLLDARRLLMQGDEGLSSGENEDKALTRSELLFAGANKTLKNENSPMDEDDGILTALEISKLDLRGLNLVVLSACETGKGDITQGEGVFGLQRGFKKAGASTIVMSLWKVDDEATEMMMTQFYKNLCDGMEKHEALHSAQKHVREYTDEKGEKKYNYPHFWAGFFILD